MKKIIPFFFVLTIILLPSLCFSGAYDMPDKETIKARIAALHPDFAEHLTYVYSVAGKQCEPIHLVAGLGFDIIEYKESQKGFGSKYSKEATAFLRDVFIRKLLADHPDALTELEELELDEGMKALSKAVMMTMPSKDALTERLDTLSSLFKIPHLYALAEKEVDVMEIAAALLLDFYDLAKSAGDNRAAQNSAVAVFMLQKFFLEKFIGGDQAAVAKLKEVGAFIE